MKVKKMQVSSFTTDIILTKKLKKKNNNNNTKQVKLSAEKL